jgi:hypothetical protein
MSQGLLIFVWFIDTTKRIESLWSDDRGKNKSDAMFHTAIWIVIGSGISLAALTTVGGTTMQLLGVYRNCICIAGIMYAFNYNGGVVDLATDTKEDRDSWTFWWRAGLTAFCFFTAVLLVASFHEMWMKQKCDKIIEQISSMTPYRKEGNENEEKEEAQEELEYMELLSPIQRLETLIIETP